MPPASSIEARKRMQATGRRDTKPEMALRKALHALGYRYRVDQQVLPTSRRRADIVFTGPKVAVFVDGCFWHGCEVHGSMPKANPQFWKDKIEANQKRDRDTDASLVSAGWQVIRIWEHVAVVDGVEAVVAALTRCNTTGGGN